MGFGIRGDSPADTDAATLAAGKTNPERNWKETSATFGFVVGGDLFF